MLYYETMYIAHPALEGGRLKDLILSVEKIMNQLEGKTCVIDVWGKKKLAYSINKEKYGIYILFQFESDGSNNKEFNLELEHNPNILAYLTTKIKEDKILTDISSLDIQLGLSKEEESTETEESTSEVIEESTETEESTSEVIEESTETAKDDSDDNNKEEK